MLLSHVKLVEMREFSPSRRCTITALALILLEAFPFYAVTIWPIEEISYDDVASCCLDVPQDYCRGKGLP